MIVSKHHTRKKMKLISNKIDANSDIYSVALVCGKTISARAEGPRGMIA